VFRDVSNAYKELASVRQLDTHNPTFLNATMGEDKNAAGRNVLDHCLPEKMLTRLNVMTKARLVYMMASVKSAV
jgi:hypothetical protein